MPYFTHQSLYGRSTTSTCRLRIFRHNFGYVETLHCNVSTGLKYQLICINRAVLVQLLGLK
jgi:hypothetical protein